MQKQVILLELNEVNFDYIQSYVARGQLPHLAALIARHGVVRTTSEDRYERLEPWIQWVTAHTGQSFCEHGVFRLGDIIDKDIPQIWELLEERGFKVGAISPMNAKYRLKDPAFFVPDPWTRTQLKAGRVLRRLYDGLVQAVNDNANARISAASLFGLLAGTATYASPRNYARYFSLVLRALSGPWRKALFVDLLLADVFIRELSRSHANFATLFVNAAAHIQHHYMYCSAAYDGPHRNPRWYVQHGVDPVLEAYELYDHIVGAVRRAFPGARLMLATGLHQVPHGEVTYYWRLKSHAEFLRQTGLQFVEVEPRMSRDFLVRCASTDAAARATTHLQSALAADGVPLFEVDNRGSDLFVMLTYPHEIRPGLAFTIDGRTHGDLYTHVAFVALKNGEHNGTGYFLDSGAAQGSVPAEFPLSDMPRRVMEALNVDTPARQTA